MKKKLLVHACCAPCAVYPAGVLGDYDAEFFFSNSNITEKKEYDLRLEEISRFMSQAKIPFSAGEYDPVKFLDLIHENRFDGERSERCRKCISMRLECSFAEASGRGFDAVTTVLSISPHKSFEMIREEGEKLSLRFGVEFVPFDFKKNGGYQKASLLSKERGFYRQNYCGCVYSKSEAEKRRMTV